MPHPHPYNAPSPSPLYLPRPFQPRNHASKSRRLPGPGASMKTFLPPAAVHRQRLSATTVRFLSHISHPPWQHPYFTIANCLSPPERTAGARRQAACGAAYLPANFGGCQAKLVSWRLQRRRSAPLPPRRGLGLRGRHRGGDRSQDALLHRCRRLRRSHGGLHRLTHRGLRGSDWAETEENQYVHVLLLIASQVQVNICCVAEPAIAWLQRSVSILLRYLGHTLNARRGPCSSGTA